MTEKVNKINSPLTIIAIFAALAEVNATVAIGLIQDDLHHIFIWFVIGFPTLLVILFFITLNYNTKVMYSPSDFREDKNFIDSLYGGKVSKMNKPQFDSEQLTSSIAKMEETLRASFEEKFKSKPKGSITKEELNDLMNSQKDEILELWKSTLQGSNKIDFEIPEELRSQMVRWVSYPAFIPIIYAIIKENISSTSQLNKFVDKYNLPDRWDESGLMGLSTILTYDNDKVFIDEESKESLEKWFELNNKTIHSIIESFGNENNKRSAINEHARLIAQELIV